MRDGATGRSRGFGFLTFKDPKTVNIVMVKEHFLDGKIVRVTLYDVTPAAHLSLGLYRRSRCFSPGRARRPREPGHLKQKDHFHQNNYLHQSTYLPFAQIDPKRAIPKDEQEKTAKIFVGGVSQDATEAEFTDFFAQFGRVIDATLMMDKDTGRPRGFGFVTFDSDSAVERVLDYRPLEILNKPIEVKRAQPRGKIGEEEDLSRGGRGRDKFGRRDDRFAENQPSQTQNQGPAQMGMNGMSPQMMAQYWQRMQSYFQMMQQQMMANAMGGMNMNQMNPQMMQQMQQMQQMQMQKMQGGNSPNPTMQNMNPQQMQMMQQMMMQQGGGGGMTNMGGRPPSAPSSNRGFSALEQNAFEQQKYEHLARRSGPGPPAGPKGHGGGPQSWEGMYDDVPQPDGGQGGPRRNNTPSGGKPKGATPTPTPQQPSNAPANAPTGPKNAGKPGANFRGGHGGRGRYHPYGR
jgi:RNA-binding protein Musashi